MSVRSTRRAFVERYGHAAALMLLFSRMCWGKPAIAGTLSIEIWNVRNGAGLVHAALCPEAHFLKDDCPYSTEAPARSGTTVVTFSNVPPGRFAVQAFHDENRNRKVDRTFLGVPREGIAFSNDARIVLGPPKFSDAAFDQGAGSQAIRMRMRYMLGPSGPLKP